MGKFRFTIAVDFDGVIHQYTTKWERADLIPDPPIPGAFDWLDEMVKHFKVVIYSSRITQHEDQIRESAVLGLNAVKDWFRSYGLDTSTFRKLEFWTSPGKPTALIYLDDRAVRFAGEFPTKNDIHRFFRPTKYDPEITDEVIGEALSSLDPETLGEFLEDFVGELGLMQMFYAYGKKKEFF